MNQLIVELTNRLQKATLERAGGLLSREDIEEVVLASMDENVTFMRCEILLPVGAELSPNAKEIERNLKFITMREILENIVDRPELRFEKVDFPKVPNPEGVFETRKAVAITVGVLNLSPKPVLQIVEGSRTRARGPSDPASV